MFHHHNLLPDHWLCNTNAFSLFAVFKWIIPPLKLLSLSSTLYLIFNWCKKFKTFSFHFHKTVDILWIHTPPGLFQLNFWNISGSFLCVTMFIAVLLRAKTDYFIISFYYKCLLSLYYILPGAVQSSTNHLLCKRVICLRVHSMTYNVTPPNIGAKITIL